MNIRFDCDINAIAKDLGVLVEDVVSKIAFDGLGELQATTPVDTGRAKSGWGVERIEPKHARIVNNVEYIVRLNEGHSKQAPAMFVELALDRIIARIPNVR